VRDLYGTYRIVRSWLKNPRKQPYVEEVAELGDQASEDFSTYFVQIEKKRRSKFQTLGINLRSIDMADENGKEWLDYLKTQGLTSEHTVLEYGCGSLRLGKTLVENLDHGKYVGVDITDHFYKLGIANYLTEQTKAQKNANFFVIGSPEYKAQLKGRKFNFIYSHWVMAHVPPDKLETYFDNVFELMDENSLFFFDFTNSIFTIRQNELTWGYPSRLIGKIIHSKGFKYERLYGNMLKVYKI
jgi:cyclopropane fatty-acyl-phospholipid synthase-like methyltransferase